MHLLEDTNWEEGLEILEKVSDSITTTFRENLAALFPRISSFVYAVAFEANSL